MGIKTEDFKLGLFQDTSFASHLQDSKSTSGDMLCIFGSCTARSNQQCPTAVPNRKSCRWMQVLLVNGSPALQFWECVMQTLNLHRSSVQREADARCHCTHLQRSLFLRTLTTVWQLFSVSPQQTRLYLLEDTAAVIQMIMKGLSPSWRHGTRTHGVDLDGFRLRVSDSQSFRLSEFQTLRVSDSLSFRLSQTLSDSLRLSQTLSDSLRLSLTLSDSL